MTRLCVLERIIRAPSKSSDNPLFCWRISSVGVNPLARAGKGAKDVSKEEVGE
jgi:hypothetical protein